MQVRALSLTSRDRCGSAEYRTLVEPGCVMTGDDSPGGRQGEGRKQSGQRWRRLGTTLGPGNSATHNAVAQAKGLTGACTTGLADQDGPVPTLSLLMLGPRLGCTNRRLDLI